MTLVVPLQHDNYFQLFCGIFIQLFSQFGSQSMSVVFGINTTELKLKKKTRMERSPVHKCRLSAPCHRKKN